MPTFDLLSLPQDAFDRMGYCVGGGRTQRDQVVRLAIDATVAGRYTNAQLDDYHQANRFIWRPPLHLTAVARFGSVGDTLTGTAGFGFWNDPLGMTGRVRLRMPQSVWFFFAGGPNHLPLVLGDPGRGWRAAALNAATLQAGLTLPIAPFLVLMLRVRPLQQPLWRWLQRVLRLAGYGLDAERMGEWHRYEVMWQADTVGFAVDGHEVGEANVRVKGPLGLVMWIDNQFLVATPQGNLAHGTVETPGQWLELAALTVEQ